MSWDKIAVLFSGLFGIAFVYWFFLGKKDQSVDAHDSVDIKVSGGYTPSSIKVKVGRQIKLNFTRTDNNPCLEEVIIGDFKIKKYLPLNQTVTVEITPQSSGKYDISCGMNMFHAQLIAQ